MNMRPIFAATIAAAGLALIAALPARAEQPVELKPGPGKEIAEASCNSCHSLDYIRMNSPFLSPDGWKAEVVKMRTAFAAPIDDADADAILKYLIATYGPSP
jgi:mono/diheme cytochrome c family protein